MSSRPGRDSLEWDAGSWSGVQSFFHRSGHSGNIMLGSQKKREEFAFGPRDDPGAGPAGSSAGPCAGRLPRRSHRTPELAWSVLHPDRGCQGEKWAHHQLRRAGPCNFRSHTKTPSTPTGGNLATERLGNLVGPALAFAFPISTSPNCPVAYLPNRQIAQSPSRQPPQLPNCQVPQPSDCPFAYVWS